tara:strand:- start:1269 stop:2225 length:957 start_codon:yes stop_codon:yes gene_type:complete
MHKKIKSKLDIAVLMLSYNSEEFIEEAIDSFLNQKGINNWKLYIADDFSTDKTREIILRYKKSFPEKVDYFFNKGNLGTARNLFTNLLKIDTKFCVISAADDIVEDPFVLRDSCLVLENDKTLSFTYTNGYKFYEKNKELKEKINCYEPKTNPFSLKDWMENGMFYINVHSIMFRTKTYPKNFDNWAYNTATEDYIHRVFLLLAGKGYYQNKFSSLYRVRKKGAQSQINNNSEYIYLNSIETMKGLDMFAQKNYSIKYFNNFYGQHMRLAIIYMFKKRFLKASAHFITTFIYKATIQDRFILLKTMVKVFLGMQKPQF